MFVHDHTVKSHRVKVKVTNRVLMRLMNQALPWRPEISDLTAFQTQHKEIVGRLVCVMWLKVEFLLSIRFDLNNVPVFDYRQILYSLLETNHLLFGPAGFFSLPQSHPQLYLGSFLWHRSSQSYSIMTFQKQWGGRPECGQGSLCYDCAAAC